MAPATWQVGTITVPSATGSQSVTGLGGEPKAVFFFGTNWLTEDAAVTTTATGMFRGMASPNWDNPGTIEQSSACAVPAGDAHETNNYAIQQLDTSGTQSYLHRATFTSFDADGFTVNWGVVTAGGYQVVYVALMDVANVGGYVGTGNMLTPGWKAGAGMLHGARGGPVVGGSNLTGEFWGSGAYFGSSGPLWQGAGLTAISVPAASGSPYITKLFNQNPGTVVAQGAHFVGPFLAADDMTAYPTGTDFIVGFGANNGGMVVIWDDEDSRTGSLTPGASQGNTVTVSGLPFAPGLVIGYSISDEPDEQGTGSAQGAVGFSVVTENFQWTALADGADQGAFQSFQRGVADTVNGTDVHAATIELTSDGFVVTTEEDDVSASPWVWHAFGHPGQNAIWIPHIYRRVMSAVGPSPRARPVTGDILLENGDRIELEEGGGVLLL